MLTSGVKGQKNELEWRFSHLLIPPTVEGRQGGKKTERTTIFLPASKKSRAIPIIVHVPNERAAHHGTNDPFRDVSNVNDVQT